MGDIASISVAGIKRITLAGLIGLAGMTVSHADVALTAIVPFTKVDSQYQQLLAMYDRFHKANPDISIQFDFLEHDAYHQKMQALAISGNLPNIMALWPGKRTGYVTDKGYAKDLGPYIKRDDLAKTQKDIFLAPQGKNGEVYELAPPFVNYSNVVYANKALMTQLGLTFPKTLADFEAQAPKITAAGYRPVVYGDQSSWVMQSCLLSMLTARIGGLDWFQKARVGNGAGFGDPPFIKAIATVQEMVKTGLIDPSEPSTTREAALAAFVSGKSVYFIGGIWEVANLEPSLPDAMKSQIGMYTFPDIAGQLTSGNSSSGALNTGYGISASSTDEQAEAAWKWVKFNIDFANADILVASGTLPVYKDASIESLIKTPLALASYHFSSGIDTVLPVIDDWMDAEGVEQIVNAGLQEVILGTTTPEDLAKKYETWVAANDSNRKH